MFVILLICLFLIVAIIAGWIFGWLAWHHPNTAIILSMIFLGTVVWFSI